VDKAEQLAFENGGIAQCVDTRGLLVYCIPVPAVFTVPDPYQRVGYKSDTHFSGWVGYGYIR